ncbi:MAG TPA: hypothetical protein VGO47_07390 [Chlamydiales bacterium]|nr:hypothetical protein [Chlamydiales bacterium]
MQEAAGSNPVTQISFFINELRQNHQNNLRRTFSSGDRFAGAGKVMVWIVSRLLARLNKHYLPSLLAIDIFSA